MDIPKFDSRFQILRIARIEEENATTRTFVFEYPLHGKPGQFLMMWIPDVDEKPMSIAFCDEKEFWVTVCNVGPTSGALHDLKVGDKVGVRGPLGTFYEYGDGEHLALVAGGYGAAPMYFVAREAVAKGCKIEFLVGARNKDLLLYLDRVAELDGVNVHVATDDGSQGHKGFVTEVLREVLRGKISGGGISRVFTCGPEVMMKAVGHVADEAKVPVWMSMEKYMKCGIGVCGQCAIDDTGDLVCVKGPVMEWSYLRDLPEMGAYHRDAQGKKHHFKSK